MVPLWVFGLAGLALLALGILIGLLWTGRASRSQHSFYDDAVSVAATIQRVSTSGESADEFPEEPVLAENNRLATEYQTATEQTCQFTAPIDNRPPEVQASEPRSSVVRYYFAETRDRSVSVQQQQIPELPGGVPPVPELDTRHTSRRPKHALREGVA